jgi:carbon storage regulator
MAMLVLSRKTDEVVVIGGVIRVMVLEIRGNVVRLGIDAPDDVTIHRQEVHDTIASQGLDPAQRRKQVGRGSR